MSLIDWIIAIVPFLLICYTAYVSKKHMRSVADFLAANRCAGKYLLGVADGIAGLGAISIIGMFEMYYKAGFTASWWSMMILPLTAIAAITGWVQYRYRQTRALTMAQFFEMRYSRKFRVFAGFLCALSGVVNFAIFPAVGGRFFQYYCGIPTYYVSLGPIEVDLIFGVIMALLLLISLAFTFMGGQIAVIITDCIQGIYCNIIFLIIAVYLLFFLFDWSVLVESFSYAPADASLINPVKTSGTDNFSLSYFLIAGFGVFYSQLSWQGNQGYYVAARTPHDSKMGRVIGNLRTIVQTVPMVLLPLAAFALLHHANFGADAQAVQGVLDTIDNQKLQSQQTVTIALTHILPIGLIGAFAAVMLAAFVSTHDTYLHSWGSIVVQDVVLPLRQIFKKDSQPLSPKEHIRWLKRSIFGVALFIFLFSWLIPPKLDILMFFALTGTIFLSWSGAAIIGGLYWKYGTTTGAWCATIAGLIMAIAGWFVTWYWGAAQSFLQWMTPAFWDYCVGFWPELAGEKFPINPQILFFWAMVVSILAYIEGSLVSGGAYVRRNIPLTWAAVGAFPIGIVLFVILWVLSILASSIFHLNLVKDWMVTTLPFLCPLIVYLISAFSLTGTAFNMDQLLHRGKYEVKSDSAKKVDEVKTGWKIFLMGKEFSTGDRIIYLFSYFYAFLTLVVFLTGTIYMLTYGISDEAWARFWWYYCLFMFLLSGIIVVWVTAGGIIDIKDLFQRLKVIARNDADDGTVEGNVSLADLQREKEAGEPGDG